MQRFELAYFYILQQCQSLFLKYLTCGYKFAISDINARSTSSIIAAYKNLIKILFFICMQRGVNVELAWDYHDYLLPSSQQPAAARAKASMKGHHALCCLLEYVAGIRILDDRLFFLCKCVHLQLNVLFVSV